MDSVKEQAQIYDQRVGELKHEIFSRYELFGIEHLKKVINETQPNLILDLGCGSGKYLKKLKSEGITQPMMGLDISANSVSYARHNVPGVEFNAYDGYNLPLKDQSVDFIMMNHVLEHVEDKSKLLIEINKKLSPQGTFLVAVPNNNCLPSMFLRIKDKLFKTNIISSVGHQHMLSYGGYSKVLENSGFKIISSYGLDVFSYNRIGASIYPFTTLLTPYNLLSNFVPFLGLHKVLRWLDLKIFNKYLISLTTTIVFVLKK